jgi:hypothetical protein
MLCAHCEEEPSACVGSYDEDGATPACNECCGHGCEDGFCYVVTVDGNEWECSCNATGEGGIRGSHEHLRIHMDAMNVESARRALEPESHSRS